MNTADNPMTPSHPRLVRVLIILVAITIVVSLLYAIQYYAGSPVRLSVVSEIHNLALSPDATLVAAGAEDGKIRVWEVPQRFRSTVVQDFDVAAAESWPVRTLSGHNSPVIEVAFAPDGSTLISVSRDGEVRRWAVASGQVEQKSDTGGGLLNDADLSASGEVLATIGEDGVVRVRQIPERSSSAGDWAQEIQTFGPGEHTRLAVALSADGSLVAAGDGVDIQIWDVQSGEAVQKLEGYCEDETLTSQEECDEADEDWLGHDKEVMTLAFSPTPAGGGTGSQLLATGSADTTIVFWEIETGQVAWDSSGHWGPVTNMVFHQQGDLLLSGGRDFKVRNFRVLGGKVTATFEGHLSTVNSVAYGPLPDTILTAGDDGTLRVWETANQYVIHMEWAQHGFQPVWGKALAAWMLISGLLGFVCLWGLWRIRIWSHLLTLGLYLLGPIVVLGLPLLEVLSYPVLTSVKLQIAWPLIVLAVWYVVLLVVLMREPVALFYEAPHAGALSEQLVVSRRTVRTRLGIFGLAVWIGLLVVLYSVLRRFNLDVAFMGHFLRFIMLGSGITFIVSALSIVLAVILALLGAMGRLSGSPIFGGISGFYISLIRGTPLLVQIYIWYLGLARLGIVLEPMVAGILALGINYGAYMTEIFRAGIQAISKGQHEAAEALGMSSIQTYRRIVLPQAFRIVIPPIGNEFIAMMKDSSLVSVITVQELTWRASKIGRQNFRNMETFIIAAAFYWILTVIFQFLQGKLEEHMARGERR